MAIFFYFIFLCGWVERGGGEGGGGGEVGGGIGHLQDFFWGHFQTDYFLGSIKILGIFCGVSCKNRGQNLLLN